MKVFPLLITLAFLTGCTQPASSSETQPSSISFATIEQIPLNQPSQRCQDTFTPHTLDHTTMTVEQNNPLFESNGSGLAINDLDNDGYLDIVLANLDGPNAIFWNRGNLEFEKEPLSHGDSRAVNIVDYDGDGWLDIAFTRRRLESILLWHNLRGTGQSGFERLALFEGYSGYAMSWADLDGDNDLDMVTGAYDIEQEKMEQVKNLYEGQGVVYFENQGETFAASRLTPISQALALFLLDLNDDQQLDILVGNDFFHPDQLWLRQDDGWVTTKLFDITSQNTMSIDVGDLNNNGQVSLFAADMKPYPDEPMEAWQPLMDNMMHDPFHNDPQIMANVLQVQSAEGKFEEVAGLRGLDATGWTWSTKFGDLDNDGYLDFYAVNGMIDPRVFKHMPNNELVEANQALRNDGQGFFASAPEWGLNVLTGGRGMSMADLDNDGDLDIVVNNFQSPTQLFENQLCGGQSIEVDLFWPDSGNTRAIGSRLILHTTTGVYQRDVRAASGYLSGDPARVHFGFPADSTPTRLEIHWPDKLVVEFTDLAVQTKLSITR
ncbi:MAG: CRTAC1 family protein [Chloroflexota bacterium]